MVEWGLIPRHFSKSGTKMEFDLHCGQKMGQPLNKSKEVQMVPYRFSLKVVSNVSPVFYLKVISNV